MAARLRNLQALVLASALIALPPFTAAAQQPAQLAPSDTASTVKLTLAGLGMGVAGVLGGMMVGGAVEHFGRQALARPCPPKEFCETGEGLGAFAGFTLGIPLGVHLANHRRGSYWKTSAASAGVAVVLVPTGLFLLRHQGGDAQQNLTFWPTVAAEVVVSIVVERHTTPPAPIPAPKPQATSSR